MNITYKIIDVNLDLGILTLDIELTPGLNVTKTVEVKSIATSSDAAVPELLVAMNVYVKEIYKSYFPPKPPKPNALLELRDRQISVEV